MNAFTPIVPLVEAGKADPKLAFLTRAAARFELVEASEMNIDEAFDSLVVCLLCACGRELVERWERDHPHQHRTTQRRGLTPQSTIDAILYCVRERGLVALREPANIDRISRLSSDERARLDARIEKVISDKSN
jgi:hypothetical protein